MPEVDGADSAVVDVDAARLGGIPVKARPMLKGGASSPELETAAESDLDC
jgi:hypothetical protein